MVTVTLPFGVSWPKLMPSPVTSTRLIFLLGLPCFPLPLGGKMSVLKSMVMEPPLTTMGGSVGSAMFFLLAIEDIGATSVNRVRRDGAEVTAEPLHIRAREVSGRLRPQILFQLRERGGGAG